MAINIPDIPKDAPLDADQRLWLQGWLADTLKTAETESVNGGKPRIVIMFGSESGNAQALSEGFAERLAEGGWQADTVGMEEYEKIDLTKEHLLLVVTSTWGEGDPPENAVDFWTAFSQETYPELDGLKYSVLALGDTNYADFCEMGRRFDGRLEQLGAERFAPRMDCDVDYEDSAEEWFEVIVSQIDKMGFKNITVTPPAGGEVKKADEKPAADLPYSRKNPYRSKLLKKFHLNKKGSLKDTRHLELSLAGSDLSYEVGDVLGLFPENDPELVDEMLSIMPFNTKISVEAHNGKKMPLRDALIELYDIRTIAKSTLKKWAALCHHPWLKAVIDDSDEINKLIDGREIIDLLYDFPADFKNAQDFVGVLRKLNPRLYSIASSINAHPGEVHLTIAKVEYNTHGRHRKGVASTYTCDRLETGQRVGIFLQVAKHFKLPEDPSRDVIMVGPGTGIAPFRAFLEERRITKSPGRNWLFFGNPHEATDYFYEEEFEHLQVEGVLTRLDLAWSRDQAQKVYVQNKMDDAAEELWKWVEGGSHLYVCGDATYMAGDVDKALHNAIEKFGGLSETETADYVAQMKADKRYQRDVY